MAKHFLTSLLLAISIFQGIINFLTFVFYCLPILYIMAYLIFFFQVGLSAAVNKISEQKWGRKITFNGVSAAREISHKNTGRFNL